MKFKKSNVKHNILFLLIVSSLLFLCGFMFLPEKNTYSETSWSDIVAEQDIFAFERLGNGTLESPFLISNAKQLATLSKLVYTNARFVKNNQAFYYSSSYFKLADNIDLSSYEWNPIGITAYPFRGTFDGNGNVISGLKINSSSNVIFAGLFGFTNGATIKNLSIMNGGSSINANSSVSQTYAGAYVAYAQNSTLENLTNLGVPVYSFSSDTAYSGGIVGFSSSCNFNLTSNYANVLAYVKNDISQMQIFAYAGGIVGRAYGASNSIIYARNNGTIKAYADGSAVTYMLGIPLKSLKAKPNIFSGGIIGQSNVIISESFNSGEIICGGSSSFVLNNITYSNYLPTISYAGGIAGKSTNSISYTFNTGNVTANAVENTFDVNNYGRTGTSNYSQQVNSEFWFYVVASTSYFWNIESDYGNDSKVGNKIMISAYAGGITGYSDSAISYSYNDGEISGGKTTAVLNLFQRIIKTKKTQNGAGGRLSESTESQTLNFEIEFTFVDAIHYASINGNRSASTTSSYGKNDYIDRTNKIVVKHNGITYENTTSTEFSVSTNMDYISNVKFCARVTRNANNNNLILALYMSYTLSYRPNINGIGQSTGSYTTKYVLGHNFSDHTVLQKISHINKSASNITTTNLGGSTYWAKTSGINGGRPYIKDFYW